MQLDGCSLSTPSVGPETVKNPQYLPFVTRIPIWQRRPTVDGTQNQCRCYSTTVSDSTIMRAVCQFRQTPQGESPIVEGWNKGAW